MRLIGKSALVLGVAGAMALGSMTASEARSGRVIAAGAAGFVAGAAIGAAAASANSGYYNAGYYYGEPAYGYGYSPGYDSYGYSPGYAAYGGYNDAPAMAYTGSDAGYYAYAAAPGYRSGNRGGHYDGRYRSTPRHYDPGAGYNSNTVAPWQDWKNQGHDY